MLFNYCFMYCNHKKQKQLILVLDCTKYLSNEKVTATISIFMKMYYYNRCAAEFWYFRRFSFRINAGAAVPLVLKVRRPFIMFSNAQRFYRRGNGNILNFIFPKLT